MYHFDSFNNFTNKKKYVCDKQQAHLYSAFKTVLIMFIEW